MSLSPSAEENFHFKEEELDPQGHVGEGELSQERVSILMPNPELPVCLTCPCYPKCYHCSSPSYDPFPLVQGQILSFPCTSQYSPLAASSRERGAGQIHRCSSQGSTHSKKSNMGRQPGHRRHLSLTQKLNPRNRENNRDTA